MPKVFHQHEFVLLAILVGLCLVIGSVNPAFLEVDNLFGILTSSVTPGILALGALVVLISGNIDISFPSIAAFSLYVTTLLATNLAVTDQIMLLLVISAAVGCLLGLVNAVLVHHARLPALIVTLGTGSLIRGGLLAFIGTRIITDLPDSMIAFSKRTMWQVHSEEGASVGLAVSVPIFLALALLTHLILTRTMLGRGIYALGGAPESARRVGFNIALIQLFIYGFMGFLAGLVGILHAAKMRNANPFDLAGLELNVIAAVVLGGASITGGRGTVLGTLLGVALLVVIGNSLLLVGLPSVWHKVATGLIIIVSTGFTAWRGGLAPSTGGAS